MLGDGLRGPSVATTQLLNAFWALANSGAGDKKKNKIKKLKKPRERSAYKSSSARFGRCGCN